MPKSLRDKPCEKLVYRESVFGLISASFINPLRLPIAVMIELSTRQKFLLQKKFPAEIFHQIKCCIEQNAGKTIPFCGNSSPSQLDRIRFAIIKLSEGCPMQLNKAIELAHNDWRDLLMSAEFGANPHEHNLWFDKELDIIAWWRC